MGVFYYFSLKDARREFSRAEQCLLLERDQSGSQPGAGLGDVEMAEQQQRKEGFVRLTGEGGEDWISGSPLTTSAFCF